MYYLSKGEAYNEPKPQHPYIPGQKFCAFTHIPPAPMYKRSWRSGASQQRQEVNPVERCILNPPAPGQTGTDSIHFEIINDIRTGDGHLAQVFAVQVTEMSTSTIPLIDEHYVVKVYDPLYCDHADSDVGDPFDCVDRAYTREVAAYKMLQPLQGTGIPNFYGSFTLDLPIPGRVETRSVRLILLELVPGVAMKQLHPSDFSQETRQAIMKAIVDIESLIFMYDIIHADLFPRNVMVLQEPSGSVRIRIFDFGSSRHRVPSWEGWCRGERAEQFLPGTYISPILRWDRENAHLERFSDWIDWDWNFWLGREYESTKDSITDGMMRLWGPRLLT